MRASMLTIEYSIKAPNTNMRQVAIQTSIALVKEPAGLLASRPLLCVVMVRMVRMLSEILAGVDAGSIQKDNHDNRTTRKLGRYVVRM